MAANEAATYKCRRCRFTLCSADELDSTHRQLDSCSCLFLETDKTADWINASVEQAGWTNGKLKCPKCKGRVGGFNFVNPIPCHCERMSMPAVWFVKGKVDESKTLPNLPSHSSNDEISGVETVQHDSAIASQSVHRRRKAHAAESESRSSQCNTAGLEVLHRSSSSSTDSRLEVNISCKCSTCHGRQIDLSMVRIRNEEEDNESLLVPCECPCSCDATPKVLLCSGNSISCCNKEHVCIQNEMRLIRKELDRLHGQRDRSKDVPLDELEFLCSKTDNLHQVKEVEISRHHQCPVCLDLLYDPLETPCQHVFCSPCLKQLHHASSGCPLCPLCRQPVHFVRGRLELTKELKSLYSPQYKNRHRFESCRPCRMWPLPSPSNTNFPLIQANNEARAQQANRPAGHWIDNDTSYLWLLLADTLSTVKLVLLLFCHLLLLLVFHHDSVTAHGHRSLRRSVQRFALLLFSLSITCFLIVAGGALVVYAFDFVKLALVIIACYAGLVKLIIVLASDRN